MSEGLFNKHDIVQGVLDLLDNLTVKGRDNITIAGSIIQMLKALQKGLKDEDKAKNNIIETLKEQLKRATTPEPEPGGDVVGGEEYHIGIGGVEE